MFKKSLLLMLLMTLLAPWAVKAQQSAPYNEGFEAMSNVTDLNTAGWEMLYQSHSGSFLAIETGASNVFAGSKALNIDSWNAGSSSDWVIVGLPTISNKAVNELQMTFSYKVSTGNVYIGYLTDPDDYSTFVTVESFNSSSSYSTKTVEFGGVPATATRIAIKYLNYYRCYVDEVEVKQLPNCKTPQNLTPSNLNSDRVTLTWERNAAGTEDAWILEYGTTSDFTGATTVSVTGGNPTKTLTGLTENTKYYARVKADCGGEESDPTAAISFTTLCEPTTIPTAGWSENFDSYTHTSNTTTTNNLPDCWSYINTTTYSSYQGYPYVYYGSSYSSSGNYHLRLYSYYSSWSDYDPQPQYAILPPMDNLTGKQITLKARGYNTSSTFKIGTMTDPSDVTTFTAITEQTLTTTYEEFTYPLSGTNVCIAIMIDAANSSRATNSVYIDDIVINDAPNCVKPIGLDLEATGQTATFTWTSDASQWQVAYSKDASADPDDNIVGLVDVKSFTKDNLELDTDHYFWVRTYCGTSEQSDWAGPVSVHIGYCVPAPTSVDNNGISNVTFGTGENIVNNNTHPTSSPYYGNYTAQVGAVQAGVESSIAITYATGYDYNTYVWVDLNNDLNFSADEVVCYGLSSSTNPTTLTLNFTIPSTQKLGDYRMRLGGADSGLGSNPANANPCYTGTYGIFEDYTLRVLEKPSCLTPTALNVTTNSGTATATWSGEGTSYNIDINGTVTNNVTSPYEFAVELSTDYAVKVQANCAGDETSDWSNVFNLTTPPCVGGHLIEYTLNDQYNDSWNGASISIMEGCTLLTTLTLASGQGPLNGSLTLCGDYYQFIWNSGNYDNECSFTFTEGGTILFTKPSPLSDGQVLYTIGTPSSCAVPSDLTHGTPDVDEVELSWTENGTATSWQICVNGDETNLVTANTNPYTLGGLTPDTDYTVKVRAYCDKDDQSCWSDEDTFTTDEACAKPTGLAATNITTESATLSWTGTNDSYVLQYRPWYPAGEDVQPTSNVMTPINYDLSSFTGTGSIVIRHYNCYNQFALVVDDIVVTNSSNEIVFSENFESCGGNMPSVFTNMDMDGDGHVWEIAAAPQMRVNGSYGLASYSFDNDTGDILYPDNWLIINNIPMGGSITFNYCAQDGSWTAENFCVYVSTESSIVEIPLNATTYDAPGLEPNTPYAWQVKGVCPKYQSNWVSSFFQTLNDVIFFQTDGNWNDASNWDVNRVPTADDKVQIDADAIIPDGVVAYAKTTTMGTGSITINEGGQLKQGTTTVDVTVEKSITGYGAGDDHWNLIATPVGTTLFASYTSGWGYAQNLLNNVYDLYAFDATQPGEEWYNYKANTSDFTKLYANQGYLYANSADVQLNFIGTTPVKSLNHTVNVDFVYDGESTNPFNGFVLVGNPYTCQAYLTFTPAGADPENIDFYVMKADGSGFELGQTEVALNVCQGAFFYADATGTINFSSEVPTSKRGNGALNINLAQNGKTADMARIRFGEGMRLAKYQLNESSKIYFTQEDKDYAVVHTQAEGEMPLNFKAETTGQYTISFKLDGANVGYLHLIDKATGEDINLLTSPEYNFIGSTRDEEDRFIIRFNETASNDFFVYQSGDQLVVNGEGTLQVYDVLGRFVASYNVSGTESISASQFENAVYIFRLVGTDVKTQKIVVR